MDFAHLHLLITHLPIFGTFIGTFVILYGLATKSHQTIIASYCVFLIACTGGVIAYLTGESAEETVEHIQEISKKVISEHEESAELAIIGIALLGFSSATALIFNMKMAFRNVFAFTILIISIISLALVTRTGYLGGKIRHTEIRATG